MIENHKREHVGKVRLGVKLQHRSNKQSVEVLWYNRDQESYKPKDILVIKTDKHGHVVEKHCIEVKTTTSSKAQTARLPRRGLLKMVKYHAAQQESSTELLQRKYSIFRVYNAGKSNAAIKVIEQPIGKIIPRGLVQDMNSDGPGAYLDGLKLKI